MLDRNNLTKEDIDRIVISYFRDRDCKANWIKKHPGYHAKKSQEYRLKKAKAKGTKDEGTSKRPGRKSEASNRNKLDNNNNV